MSETGVSHEVQDRIRRHARHRCGYCLASQRFVYVWLELDHIIPRAEGGPDDEDNLWLACRMCNGYKGAQTHARDPVTNRRVRLFNPRRQRWSDHFRWGEDGTEVLGKTPCGRATIEALQLNNVIAIAVRAEWVSVGWHPPKDVD
ncbi:MAG TPA: HNH endonuclease signature motif containing protein [Gemmataceae bacterium]|nr:HNH endonuclease signature motif containing protein [Gemmataceae bacterium]